MDSRLVRSALLMVAVLALGCASTGPSGPPPSGASARVAIEFHDAL